MNLRFWEPGLWSCTGYPHELMAPPITAHGEKQKMEPKEGRYLRETKAAE